MSQLLLLRGAKQLLTLRGAPNVRRGAQFEDLAVIQDGSVLIRDGKIVSVGPTRRLENMRETRDAIDVPVHGRVVMPGFVDSGIQLSLLDPSKNPLQPRRKKLAEFHQEGLTLMRSCLQHGTLTAGIRTYSGRAASDMAALRQLTRIGDNPVGMIRSWRLAYADDEYPPLHAITEALATIRKHKLASLLELHGDTGQPAQAPIVSAAGDARMDISVTWPGGDAAQLDRILRTVSPVSVFCQPTLSAPESEVLVRSKAAIVFKAGRDLLEQRPLASLFDLAAAGGVIALASGYDAKEEMNFNMQWVLALAVMRLRLSVEQAIVASTINAAYAMKCGDRVGSLEVDKRADMLVLNLDDYRELARRPGTNHVGMVIRNGNIVINRTSWRVGAA